MPRSEISESETKHVFDFIGNCQFFQMIKWIYIFVSSVKVPVAGSSLQHLVSPTF